MNIRATDPDDRQAIKDLYLQAFDPSEAETVSSLALELASDESALSIAADDGGLIGHVTFSPVMSKARGERIGLILAPLAVHPEHQKKGIGSQLTQAGLDYAKQENLPMVFVYGDPAYYGRFGFTVEAAEGFTPPCPLQYPQGWQAVRLSSESQQAACPITCVDALNDPSLW